MGKIYIVEIGFDEEKHCLECPMRDKDDDTCNMMQWADGRNIEYVNFEDQMLGCPLRFVREVE